MGSKEKTTQQSSQSSQTQYQRSPEEIELDKSNLRISQAAEPGQIAVNQSGLSAVNNLLSGQDLPGYLKQLPYGISEDVTGGIVNSSLRDMNTQLAASGAGTFLESGAAQAAGVRAASDIRNQAAQFNLNNLMQLLNIGVGGQASVQQPINQNNTALGSRLAGLAGVSQSGNYSGSTLGMNPFMKSFQQSAGSGMGNVFNPQTYFKPGA